MAPTYDRLARFYDGFFAPLEHFYLAKFRAETVDLLPANARILEVGAGTGANFRYYPPCEAAIASELSMEMLDRAKEKSDRISLVQADAEQMPFPANHFDAAFATLVFCSVPDAAAGFAEIKRVLKPGGMLLLAEHVRPPGILGSVFDLLSVATVAIFDDHFNRRTSETVRASGFQIERLDERLGGALVRIVASKPLQTTH